MATTLTDIPLTTIDGRETTLAEWAGKTILIVNVASRCGLTPQYEQLEQLQKKYGERGFTVLGFPCNQFMFQEPGNNEEIAEYCSATWGSSVLLAMNPQAVSARASNSGSSICRAICSACCA
mgnify:CR=1 FL=1